MITIVGCPRSGTKYISELFKLNGFDVGHEEYGKDGTSNWCLALPIEKPLYGTAGDGVRVHQIRNPLHAIPSICLIQESSWRWIEQFIILPPDDNMVFKSAIFWLKWNKIAESSCQYCYRIENLDKELFSYIAANFIGRHFGRVSLDLKKNINTRIGVRPKITVKDLPIEVKEYAESKGYVF